MRARLRHSRLPALALLALAPLAVPAPASGACKPGVRSAADEAIARDPVQVLPEDRRATWDPGVPGGIPHYASVHATIDAGKYGNGTTDATDAIRQAIAAAGKAATARAPQVVLLPAGQYRITDTLVLDRSHVVLRGEGKRKTVIRMSAPGKRAIWVGRVYPPFGRPVDVVGGARRGARRILLSDASGVEPGDVLQIDQVEDGDARGTRGWVWRYDITWGMRGPRGTEDANGPDSPEGYRPIGQQIEVAARHGNEIELSMPLYMDYPASARPQVFHTATAREGKPGIRRSGVEDLTVQGGRDSNILLSNAAYAWVRNVESDGAYPTFSGRHVSLFHCFRCEVRESFVHHSSNYWPGGNAYGIAVGGQSTASLVENNVAVMLNKPILGEVTGGGNVFGYNYVDEAILGRPTGDWQESAIDASHGAFSHWDLHEGNLAPNLGTDSTHGNAGWIVFFRNHATGRNSSGFATGNLRGIGIDGWNLAHTSIGNVLLDAGLRNRGRASVVTSSGRATLEPAAAYRVGANAWDRKTGKAPEYGSFDDGTALRNLHRHLDFEQATGSLVLDPSNPACSLPPSLYLRGKPDFFGDLRFPFVDPLGPVKVGKLPAKLRYDAGIP